jgi:uncharacterized protein YkwD
MSTRLFGATALVLISLGAVLGGNAEAEKVRTRIFELTNEFRKAEKKKPLKINVKLAAAAQKHAENMARQDKYGDDGDNGHILDGKGPKDRIDREGYKAAATAENVAFFSGGPAGQVGAMVMDGWKNSPKHRANLVADKLTEIGIGVAQSKTGQWYFVQDFGKPR